MTRYEFWCLVAGYALSGAATVVIAYACLVAWGGAYP